MGTSNTNLQQRLAAYAQAIGKDKEEVISVKLRPVMPGAQYTDVFGYQHANAYMYDSEYQAGKDVCELRDAQGPIAGADLHIGHPVPWSEDTSKFVRSLANNAGPPPIWIQHETGLEILYIAADIATLITATGIVFKAFEAIRNKISANANAKATQLRHYTQVAEIRIEFRQLDSEGALVQELIVCQSVHTTLSIGSAKKSADSCG